MCLLPCYPSIILPPLGPERSCSWLMCRTHPVPHPLSAPIPPMAPAFMFHPNIWPQASRSTCCQRQALCWTDLCGRCGSPRPVTPSLLLLRLRRRQLPTSCAGGSGVEKGGNGLTRVCGASCWSDWGTATRKGRRGVGGARQGPPWAARLRSG